MKNLTLAEVFNLAIYLVIIILMGLAVASCDTLTPKIVQDTFVEEGRTVVSTYNVHQSTWRAKRYCTEGSRKRHLTHRYVSTVAGTMICYYSKLDEVHTLDAKVDSH